MAKQNLTKEQIEAKADQLANKVIELEQLQTKNKEKKKKLKEGETELEVEIAELAVEVKTGQEEVDDQTDAFEETKTKKRGLKSVKPPEEEEEPEEKH